MRYAATLASTAEREFLAMAKIGSDGRAVGMDRRDMLDLLQLDRRTDRVLPNGYCLLPPTRSCDKGNACHGCDHFATDRSHLPEIRRQLAETEQLIEQRKDQHLARYGEPMSEHNIWLEQRLTEIRSMRLEVTALQAQPDDAASSAAPASAAGPATRTAPCPSPSPASRVLMNSTSTPPPPPSDEPARYAAPPRPSARPPRPAQKPRSASSSRTNKRSTSGPSPERQESASTSSTPTPTCATTSNSCATQQPRATPPRPARTRDPDGQRRARPHRQAPRGTRRPPHHRQ